MSTTGLSILQIQTDQFIAVVIAWIAFGSLTVTAQGFEVPPETQFQAIAAGQYHNTAIRQDGTAVGWGDDEFGRALVPRDGDFTTIACGLRYSIALRRDGPLVAWRRNQLDQTDVPGSNNLLNH